VSEQTNIQEENRLLRVLSEHPGKARAISMPALQKAIFGSEIGDKINGTRKLRQLITRLRKEGLPICSVVDQNGGGYYLASASSDIEDYLRRLRNQALRKLAIEARIRKVAMPELLGQISVALARDPARSDDGGAS
jgi:biotin operon repressor